MSALLQAVVVAGLVVSMTAASLAHCLTDNLTAEQKACCAAMHHDCGTAGVEMGCCPSEPQLPDLPQMVVKPAAVPVAIATGALAVLPEPYERLHHAAATSFSREILKLPDRPTYLLVSLLLI